MAVKEKTSMTSSQKGGKKSSQLVSLVGNQTASRHLKELTGRFSRGAALLLSGPQGVGKRLFALRSASALLVHNQSVNSQVSIETEVDEEWGHPDLYTLDPEGRAALHTLESIHTVYEQIALRSQSGRGKVVLINEAHRMQPVAANALLKTLEEPPEDTLICLITSQKEALLSTVVSRCRTLSFAPLTEEEIVVGLEQRDVDRKRGEEVACLAHGSLGRAWRLLHKGEAVRKALLCLLTALPALSYCDLTEKVGQIAHLFEEERKRGEAEIKAKLKSRSEGLSSQQRDIWERTLEGQEALAWLCLMDDLFLEILGWYRDLHLIRLQAKGSLNLPLWHRDQKEQLMEAAQCAIPAFQEVEKAILIAKEGVERFTKPAHCLEGLFLKLISPGSG
jgi:DNA polymerase-3 subunit delta'